MDPDQLSYRNRKAYEVILGEILDAVHAGSKAKPDSPEDRAAYEKAKARVCELGGDALNNLDRIARAHESVARSLEVICDIYRTRRP